jgi:hypothetical protein
MLACPAVEIVLGLGLGSRCARCPLRSTLILHIGLERTGTNSFHRFCANYRRQLRKASILFPTHSLAYSRGWRCHVPLASCYFHPQLLDLSVPFSPERKASILASLFRDIDSSDANVALLSSEHFSSRMRLPQVKALAADLAGYECRVGVVVRDHVSRFFSSYSKHVVTGSETSLDAYADGMLSPESLYVRYAETIRLWEEAFGKEHVAVFAYDRKGDILRAMIERFAPEESKKLSLPPLSAYGDNFSYGPILTEAFRRANARATEHNSWSNTPRVWMRKSVVSFLLEMWLRTTRVNPRAGVWALDESRMARLMALAEADRKWLSEHYGVRIPEEIASSAAKAELPDFCIEKFLNRADLLWRLTGVAEPIFAAAPFIASASRLALSAVKL